MPKEKNNQVTLILDEFVRLGKLESIAELPSISRGYNVNTIFVAQDYEQITNTYSKEYILINDALSVELAKEVLLILIKNENKRKILIMVSC